MDEDRHSQPNATFNMGERGGCSNDFCIFEITMKLPDICKSLSKSTRVKAYFANSIPTHNYVCSSCTGFLFEWQAHINILQSYSSQTMIILASRRLLHHMCFQNTQVFWYKCTWTKCSQHLMQHWIIWGRRGGCSTDFCHWL